MISDILLTESTMFLKRTVWDIVFGFVSHTWENHEDYGSFLSKLSSPAILHHLVPVSASPDLPAVLREDSMGESQLRVTTALKECGLHTATSFTSMESKAIVLIFRWKMTVCTASSHICYFSFWEQFLCVQETNCIWCQKTSFGSVRCFYSKLCSLGITFIIDVSSVHFFSDFICLHRARCYILLIK